MTESLTQQEVSKRLGIAARTVRKHSNDGRIPRNEDGSYPWPEVRDAWLELKVEAKKARDGGFGGASYEEARARKVAAQARLAEFEAAEREGSLVALDDVESLLRTSLEKVNAVLKTAPSRHGSALAKRAKIKPSEARRILAEIIEEVRAELRESHRHAA